MRTASYRLSDLQKFTIPLGFVGENEHYQIIFLADEAYAEYPHAAVSLTVRPPYGEPYPAVVTRDGNNVLWTIKDSDLTRSGQGEIQLSFTTSEVVAKTYVGKTKVCRSIVPTGEVPDPIDDFLTEAGAALTAIPETIDAALEEAKESGEFDGPQGPQGPEGPAGQTGATGNGIVSIEKTGTSGLTDTYTITFTNGNSTTFTVKNGKGIVSIAKTGTSGNVDTYTITFNDGDTTTFTVTNANIDDTAGDGDTDKTWSANKIDGEISQLKSALKENGKGFQKSSADILREILNNIVYTSDQSENINDLYDALVTKKNVTLTPIKANLPNTTTFAYEAKSWQSSLVWEPDYTITGGVMTVTFDDEVVTNFDIQVFIFDANKQPYKYAGYKNPENLNVQGNWTPYLYNPGTSSGFGSAAKTFNLTIPDGCYAFFAVRWNGTVYGGSEITTAGDAANWVINDSGITVTINGGVES